jgi:hypothetical protein
MNQKGQRLQEVENQNPRGVLKNVQDLRFNTTRVDITEIPVESIQEFPYVPDYIYPTESIHPIVVQTPEGLFCIDGWNLIEHARAQGQTSVRCHVSQIQNHSDIELAIRKVEIRTKPHGGTCSFAEKVRNTYLLAQLIMGEKENPIVFSHGGARRGAKYINDRENDLREMLAERLGRKRTTINQYLNFGKNLGIAVLNTLVESKAGKAFFEAVQFKKRNLINQLDSDEKTNEAITESVSSKILAWHDEYRQPVRISKNEKPQPVTPHSENQAQQDNSQQETQKTKEFKHWNGNVSASQGKIPSEEDVCLQFKAIASALVELAGNKGLTIQQRIEAASAQIIELSMLVQELKHLDIQTRVEKEGRADG